MLKRLLLFSTFCKDNEMLNDNLKLPEEAWKELQGIMESLAPYLLQNFKKSHYHRVRHSVIENLTRLLLSLISTSLAEMLVERMKARGKSILTPPVLAAIYLDREYQVLLSEKQKNSSKPELQAPHKRLLLLKYLQEDSFSITEEVPSSISKNRKLSSMQLMLLSEENEIGSGRWLTSCCISNKLFLT